ncbi:MAG TPA: tripartite tricarboxylate transporter substrate binding protein [Burkholderiales bacterium]|nr:tripartite tricarboxylate transporter substrate binding protein [Burkholderiales bacterium]
MRSYWLMSVMAGLLIVAGGVHAQQKYPTKPIRLIVPFPPGGQTDVVARTLAQKLGEALGQTVVVDNRQGGGGTIGVEMAVKSPPDGYTMVQVSTSYAANAALYKLPYDARNDIVPVVMIGEIANMVTVTPSGPFRSVKDLIAYAKANPGRINYGSGGTGSGNHLATELFSQMAGITMTHVPYKGATGGVTDLMSGQIQLIFGGLTGMIPHHKANRVRGIAVTSAKRSVAVPDLPTVGETVTGYESVSWSAILGPKGLPRDVVARWNEEINRVLQLPDVKERMTSSGLDIVGGTPADLRKVLDQDIAKWTKVVKLANIKVN